MADLLIRGMEMPTSCPCELLGTGYDLYCSFALGIPARVKEYYECCQNNKRPSWCPLVSVPPHGRLIDADRLYEKTAEWEAQALDLVERHMHDEDTEEWRKWSTVLTERSAFKFDVADAPTVIEASEVE